MIKTLPNKLRHTSSGDVKEELIPEFEKVIQWLKANKLSPKH